MLSAGLAASAVTAGAASAALEPSTPVEVAAGVPGGGRAWELVTPENTNEGFINSSNGASVNQGYVSRSGDRVFFQAIGKLPGTPELEPIVTWGSATRGNGGWADSWVPGPLPIGTSLEAVSSDLGASLWRSYEGGDQTIVRSSLDGTLATLVKAPDASTALTFGGASENLQRVFFSSEGHFLPADAARTSGASLYEIDGTGVHLVDVDDGGQLLSDCGSTLKERGFTQSLGESSQVVSSDGSRIFFTTHPGCAGPAQVFMREDAARTVEISASQCDLADCGPESDVEFVGATPSGSSAYLATAEQLTDEAVTGLSLYRYDVAGGTLTLLGPMPGSSPYGVAPSRDGARIYFLVGGYLYLADASGVHQIAEVLEGTLQTSADGRYASFLSFQALDPEDTDSSFDIYRYDAASKKFALITPGTANSVNYFPEFGVLGLSPYQPAAAMSEDGSEIFFQTEEPLLPQDHNQSMDVYEWDEGSLALISSGVGEAGSLFLGATPDGSTAFIETTDPLLPRDRDSGERDIYAARIGGGFPEPASPVECQPGACRGSVPAAPSRPAPKSAKSAKGIVIGAIDAAARRRIAASGWIVLLTEAPRSGRLSATAFAKLGGHLRKVAATAVKVAAPGPLQLRMRLSPAARARLASGHGLSVKIELHLGKAKGRALLHLRGRR